jgi:hypothetical protein
VSTMAFGGAVPARRVAGGGGLGSTARGCTTGATIRC